MALAVLAPLGLPPLASADDAVLRREARSSLPVVEAAARSASTNDPTAVQRLYDVARDMEERVRAASPGTARCRPLARSLQRYARGRVREAEGVDRLSSAARGAGQRQAIAANGAVTRTLAACVGSGDAPQPSVPLIEPASGAATFGGVVARAPSGARDAILVVDGRQRARRGVRGGRVRFSLAERSGRHDLAVRFLDSRGQTAGGSAARGVMVLPSGSRAVVPARGFDASLSAAATAALSGGPAFRSAWLQDVAGGRAGGANAGALFPAASTVKLGLLATALRRLGAAPRRSPLWPDVAAMARWSSNLATNRLLDRLGGDAASDGLRRLGARSSTFPGGYIVGTEVQPALPAAGASSSPPRASSRVTTAQDLARMLYALHAAAAGDGTARRELGVGARSARLGLGLLLTSEQRGDNRSLVAGGAPAGAPIAQKNGWIRAARHGAALVYTERGAWIAVLLTYDDRGVSLRSAAAVGARLAGRIPR